MTDEARPPISNSASQMADRAENPAQKSKQQFRRVKRDVHGWVVLDKPVGMTSTQAVGIVKRLFKAKRVGHAGTLDPLASGCLPVALGEATKTVPFVMDGEKQYRFTVKWGEERATDDSEGQVTATSGARPGADEIRAALPAFIGTVVQVPPRFSAIKVAGERAYDLARDGEAVELAPRTVEIESLELVKANRDTAEFAARCGGCSRRRAPATPARSTRSPPAACQSRSARRPRRFRS